jgi:hypothetical protein
MFTKTYSRRAVWRFFVLMAVGALTIAASLFCIGKANANPADEQAFLSQLTNSGLAIKNVSGTVTLGYTICAQLPYENGAQLAEQLWEGASSGGFTLNDMNTVVWAAVQNLCPWEYHPERLRGVSV